MPFYSAYPAYRKGGGQGSGIKHAITRFGQNRLVWLEKKSGGDARIVRLDMPRICTDDDDEDAHNSNLSISDDDDPMQHTSFAREEDYVHINACHSSGAAVAVGSHAAMVTAVPVPRLPFSRRLQNAQKRVHLVVHDHEVVSGKPMPLKQLAFAFRAMHGTDIDPPGSLGFDSLEAFLNAAPRLCCCTMDDERAVRCDPPPPEMSFVHDLRAHITAFIADRPEGITFAQLKERVKQFGQERHTSVRFLRGGILGVINCVLVPSVVIQLEPNGLFYPATKTRPMACNYNMPAGDQPPAPIGAFDRLRFAATEKSYLHDAVVAAPNASQSGTTGSMPEHDMFGGLDANLLAGVFNSALSIPDSNHCTFKWPIQGADGPATVTPQSSLYEHQLSRLNCLSTATSST